MIHDPKNTPAINDPVCNPSHYTQGAIECIDAITSALGPDGTDAWLTGNIMKYLWRWKHKNGLEDLRKAEFYLKRLISEVNTNGR